MPGRILRGLLLGAALAGWAFTARASEPPTPSGAAQESSAGDINPLSLRPPYKTDLALWTGVVFLLLLLVLWRFAWGPLMRGIDNRERAVADQIAEAESANRRAQELLAQHEQKLAEAQAEVRAIVDQARRDAEQVGRDMIEKAHAEADHERQRALREIDAATNSALKELADRSAELAVDLAGKILGARLNPADHRRLMEQAVADFVNRD